MKFTPEMQERFDFAGIMQAMEEGRVIVDALLSWFGCRLLDEEPAKTP